MGAEFPPFRNAASLRFSVLSAYCDWRPTATAARVNYTPHLLNSMSTRRPRRPTGKKRPAPSEPTPTPGLRIIGGRFRGRRLLYGGDTRVRPMKDRVREATFNLIGPSIKGKQAVDLFAGTGALALEALSRGAVRATLIEQHFPTAAIIRKNLATLGVEKVTDLVTSSVFIWLRREPKLDGPPWIVFCSPPYDFYVDRTDETLALIQGLMDRAPNESIFAVESDERFDFSLLPDASRWDVRPYPPAVVGVYRV